MRPRVILKPRRARPFFAHHPWVYVGSIAAVEGELAPGDEVSVTSAEGVFIARGLWNPDSNLRVRLYQWLDEPLDETFWRSLVRRAVQLRRELPDDGLRSAQRVVFSEGDGLSGLIADQFDRWLVVHITSRAVWLRREHLLTTLLEETGCAGVVCRFDPSLADREGVSDTVEQVMGTLPGESIEIEEAGIRFLVELGSGQKTGFYLDQSVNRLAVARYARGRRVLDTFCYTGGFGLQALKTGGAASMLGVDSSESAITLARENVRHNGLSRAEFRVNDVFRALTQLAGEGAKFDLVICDPPKFARTARDVEDALNGYVRLNRSAMDVLAHNGLLVTCSCSGHIDKTIFQNMLGHVAELAGRTIQILEMRGQAPDHPVAVACPETEYLKCAICRVT